MKFDMASAARESAKEYEYVEKNRRKLRKYAGKWIVVAGEEVVYSGKKLSKKVWDLVEKSHPGKIPFIIHIPEKNMEYVYGGITGAKA